MNKFFWNLTSIFCTLFILTFEFQYSIIPEIYLWINPFFESLVQFSGMYLTGFSVSFDSTISSDSEGLYVHVFNLVLLSLILAFLLKIFFKEKEVNLRFYLLIILAYYLSLQLLIYGFDKVFKAQFFFPEPNTLFTPLKDLSKDILYWSTMGMSRGYSMFLGGAEILVAVLLWFSKTRLIASILGVGIMLNVVAVNFGFDISVKVYSLFLLMGFLLILSPYFKYLFSVLTLESDFQKPNTEPDFLGKHESKKWIIKSFFVLLIIIEGLFPYLKTGNFNDDIFPRPKFHGAYSIGENELGLKRLFIHRHGYLIFQNEEDEFQDFQLELDTINQEIKLVDYRINEKFTLNYLHKANTIKGLQGNIFQKSINLKLKKINPSGYAINNTGLSWVAG